MSASAPVGRPPTRRRRWARSLGRGTRSRVALAERLEQEDRARDGGIERPDRAAHRDADEQVAPATDRGAQAVALAPDDDRRRPPEVCLAGAEAGLAICAYDAQAAKLAKMFAENFKRFEAEVSPDVIAAGPKA